MGNEGLIIERDQFLSQAVGSLLHQIDLPTLLSIIAGGEDEFISHAKTYWTGHGFTREDFRKAFTLLEKRAQQVAPNLQIES